MAITAGKEDGADSTATMTTTAFTSVCESQWDEYITEDLAERITGNSTRYVFGK